MKKYIQLKVAWMSLGFIIELSVLFQRTYAKTADSRLCSPSMLCLSKESSETKDESKGKNDKKTYRSRSRMSS